MKQILILTIMGFVMLMAAGCVSPVVNTPLPTSVPTPYTASPIVSFYPPTVSASPMANYTVTGSVVMADGKALNDYTVAVTCHGDHDISGQYSGLTDANGSFIIRFSSPRGYYDHYNVTVISPSKQLVYQDQGTRTLAVNNTADIML